MFESSFPYTKINTQIFSLNEDLNYIAHTYAFKGKTNKRYIVVAEQYDNSVYAVKFYLKENKNCAHKYNRLTKINECSRILTTIGLIMRDIIYIDAYASFIFVGSHSHGEQKNNTKRFKLYSIVIANFIGIVNFEHHTTPQYSAYILINRSSNTTDLLRKIEDRISTLF